MTCIYTGKCMQTLHTQACCLLAAASANQSASKDKYLNLYYCCLYSYLDSPMHTIYIFWCHHGLLRLGKIVAVVIFDVCGAVHGMMTSQVRMPTQAHSLSNAAQFLSSVQRCKLQHDLAA